MLHGLVSPNTYFDDHPLRDRLRGRISFMMESSLTRYLRRTDAVLAEAEVSLTGPAIAKRTDRLAERASPANGLGGGRRLA